MTRTRQPLFVLLLAGLAVSRCLCAQLVSPSARPGTAIDAERPISPAEQAAAQLLQTVSQAVIGLDATGDRTSEAIANSTVTLTLAPLQDGSRLSVLCLNTGEPLRAFMQSLAEDRQLSGQVLHPVCSGSGSDADPFKLQFHLHYEGGHSGLFQEEPLLLPAALYSPAYFEAAPTELDRAEDEPLDKRDVPARIEGPIPLNPMRTQTSHAVMSLPEGWSPSQLPEPVHSDSPFATLDRTVTFTDGKLVSDTQLVIKKDKVEAAERTAFETWLQSAKIYSFNPSIHLASTFYYPDSAFTGNTEDEKKAAELIQAADNDIEAKNFAKAETDLKQAESLDPGHEILHENKGMLAAARGNYEAALSEYQQELRAFPNALVEMESIAGAQRKLGRTDDAIATLQRWTTADPKSTFPVAQLMELYHDMGRDDLAVAVGDQAMITLGENGKRSVSLLMLYGQEQMLAGQPQAAKATFEALLDETTDIEFVNDAAYFLSEKGLSLDRAEETIRASLAQFDPEHIYEMPHLYSMDDKQRTQLLFATWDTLGWILYKKGQIKEAEGYIRAAWRNHPDPAIGLHLGQILSDAQKPVEALDEDKLALAAIPAKDQKAANKTPDVIALRAEVERLEKEGHTSTIADTAAALQKLRVLDAGPAGKLHGESRYHLTVTASGIAASPVERGGATEALQLINAIKLPQDFFPPDSHAMISIEAKLNCTTVCTLTLLP